jgi:hypothetical protein
VSVDVLLEIRAQWSFSDPSCLSPLAPSDLRL